MENKLLKGTWVLEERDDDIYHQTVFEISNELSSGFITFWTGTYDKSRPEFKQAEDLAKLVLRVQEMKTLLSEIKAAIEKMDSVRNVNWLLKDSEIYNELSKF